MSLIDLVLVLVIIGFVLYIINGIPMEGNVKKLLNAVVLLFVILWVLKSTGVLGMANIRLR